MIATVFEFGEFELDEGLFELRRAGARVPLQPKVLHLILHLVRNRERAVPKLELFARVWPSESVGESSLTRAVKGARAALGDTGESQEVIRNVRGHGYRFVLPARERPGASDVHASSPVPALARATATPPSFEQPFVGREDVLSTFDASLASAADAGGRLLLLVGEPGIGKTRTVAECALRARARGIEVLIGNCVEREGAPAYWPWVTLLRDYVAGRDSRQLRELMGTGAQDIVQALPELRARISGVQPPPTLDAAQARFRFFDSMVSFLKRAAAQQPLVLVFDDLQAADLPSLLLLRYVSRQLQQTRLLVVGAHRPVDSMSDAAAAATLSELARRDPSCAVELAALSREQLARFLELTLGARPAEATLQALHEQTAGNPLFWTQIVSAWRSAGSNTDAFPGPLPERIAEARGVREAIERRLETLSPACRKLLAAAAVIGREFSLDVLAIATDMRPLHILETFHEALAGGVIHASVSDGYRYRFVHGLIPEALYARIPAHELASLHHSVGLALEVHYGPEVDCHLAELAHHLVRGAPAGDAERAVDYCLRASHQALNQLAYEESALHSDRALQALSFLQVDEARTASVLSGKAQALYNANDMLGAQRTLWRVAEIARRIGSAKWLAQAAWGFAMAPELGRVDAARVALLEEAIAALDQRDPMRPPLLAVLAKSLLYSGDHERRVALVRSAVASARAIDDPSALAKVLSYGHVALTEPEVLHERAALSAELLQLAQTGGDDPVLWSSYATRIPDCLELGDMAGVSAAISAMAARAEQIRQPHLRIYTHVYSAVRSTVEGRFDAAEQHAHQAFALAERVDEMAAYFVGSTLQLSIWRHQGRMAQVAELVRATASYLPELASSQAALAWIEAIGGQAPQARERLEHLFADDLAAVRREPFGSTTLGGLAVVCCTVGDAGQSAILYEALLPYADRIAITQFGLSVRGPIAHALGLLAAHMERFDLAVQHFEVASALNGQMGHRPHLAESRCEHARVLLRRNRTGDRDRARELHASALDAAKQLGMASLLRDCETLSDEYALAATGRAAAGRAAATGPHRSS